jgi:hypothetical protein
MYRPKLRAGSRDKLPVSKKVPAHCADGDEGSRIQGNASAIRFIEKAIAISIKRAHERVALDLDKQPYLQTLPGSPGKAE